MIWGLLMLIVVKLVILSEILCCLVLVFNLEICFGDEKEERLNRELMILFLPISGRSSRPLSRSSGPCKTETVWTIFYFGFLELIWVDSVADLGLTSRLCLI